MNTAEDRVPIGEIFDNRVHVLNAIVRGATFGVPSQSVKVQKVSLDDLLFVIGGKFFVRGRLFQPLIWRFIQGADGAVGGIRSVGGWNFFMRD